MEESCGGNGANTAYALARLGVPVRLAGMVGRDCRGDTLLKILGDVGVNVERVGRSNEPTTASVCVVHPSGDRLFLHQPGASKELEPASVTFEVATGCTHFHLANPFALPRVRMATADLLGRAKAAGFSTSLDTGWDSRQRWMADIADCLPYIDLLFVNESEARRLTGRDNPDDAGKKLLDLGTSAVVIKLGAEGCAIFSDGQTRLVPGFPVRVKDTTGAGDCFCGGFLAALHRGLPYRECARFANAVGALKVQELGAVGGLRSYEETVAWMRKELN
jgi:sugar/nucleoside kinase (ribokinase family)